MPCRRRTRARARSPGARRGRSRRAGYEEDGADGAKARPWSRGVVHGAACIEMKRGAFDQGEGPWPSGNVLLRKGVSRPPVGDDILVGQLTHRVRAPDSPSKLGRDRLELRADGLRRSRVLRSLDEIA